MTYDSIPLGEVVSLQAGYGFPVELQGRAKGDYPFAKVGDISRCGRSPSSVLAAADHFIDEEDLVTLRAKLIPEGSVLFAKIGEAIRQNHRVVAGRDMLIDNNAMAAVPGKNIDSRFLYHYLRTVDFYRLAPATTVPALRKSDLEKLPIPYPPLPEQRRLAAILDKADALRAKRREASAQLDCLAQSIFREMFGDPEQHIRAGKCKELAEVVAPGRIVTYGIVQAGPEVADGIPYIKTGDIKGGEILEHQLSRTSLEIARSYARSAISSGDIVMSIRATVGTTALVPPSLEGANLTQGTARISPGASVLPTYLLNYLRNSSVQRWIQAQVKGATFREITLGKLRQLPVYVPALSAQSAYTARIQKVNKLREIQAFVLSEHDRLFEALQSRAFKGQL